MWLEHLREFVQRHRVNPQWFSNALRNAEMRMQNRNAPIRKSGLGAFANLILAARFVRPEGFGRDDRSFRTVPSSASMPLYHQPAPARISMGPKLWRAACCCSGFRLLIQDVLCNGSLSGEDLWKNYFYVCRDSTIFRCAVNPKIPTLFLSKIYFSWLRINC